MAFYDTTWYISSVKYAAVAARPQNTAVAAGQIVRQFTTPAVGFERCYVCTVAGTTANTTDATWQTLRGSTTTDGTATWKECTGQPSMNGDLAGTRSWAEVKAAGGAPTVGQIIKRNNGASYQYCTTGSGGMGASEPAFSDIAGVTTTDTGVVTWTSLGPVGNFPAWSAPHARLANAYATNWGVTGNKFWLPDNHAETQATALTLTSPALAPGGATYAICVDRTAALPPVEANYKTGATISTTSNTAITFASTGNVNVYYEGIAFSAGDGAVNNASIAISAAQSRYLFKNCAFAIGNTNVISTISVGGSTQNFVTWDNCTAQFANVGQSISLKSTNFEWRNTANAIQGAIIPTALFNPTVSNCAIMACRGVDFSALNTQLVLPNSPTVTPILFEDCKFNAATVRFSTATLGYSQAPVITVRCDSGATNYKTTRDEYAGGQGIETSITRTGGGTDGTLPISHKVVTSAQATFFTPYRMLPFAINNETVGADVTVTVYGTAFSLPLNDEIWLEVQYLASTSPIASFKSTCKSHPLAAGAAVASDSSTWNNAGAPTFDPATTVNTSLSNGNLTATHTNTSGSSGARVLSAVSSGKYYFEIAQTTTGHGITDCVGLISTTGNLSDLIIGANGIGIGRGGTAAINSSTVLSGGTSLGAFVAGDVAGFAIDFGAQLVWLRRNAGNWNSNGAANPATGVGGLSFPSGWTLTPAVLFAGSGTVAGDSNTANFGATSYANAAPSGFGNWIAWTPFKLVATLTSPQPAMKGYIYARVLAAKAGTTYYIDPKPVLS